MSDINRPDVELTPAGVAPFPSAVPAGGETREPFAVRLLSRGELAALTVCGLIEPGPSAHSSVGHSGYRLTRRGWEVVALLWYDRGPAVRDAEPQPIIPAS